MNNSKLTFVNYLCPRDFVLYTITAINFVHIYMRRNYRTYYCLWVNIFHIKIIQGWPQFTIIKEKVFCNLLIIYWRKVLYCAPNKPRQPKWTRVKLWKLPSRPYLNTTLIDFSKYTHTHTSDNLSNMPTPFANCRVCDVKLQIHRLDVWYWMKEKYDIHHVEINRATVSRSLFFRSR